MQEIKCPKCGEVFVVDESGYAQIVQQVRDKEFAKELQKREEDFKERTKSELIIAKKEQEEEFNKILQTKQEELVKQEQSIEQLKSQLKGKDYEKELAISETVNKKEEEREQKIEEKNKELAEKERIIEQLKAKIEHGNDEKNLAVSEVITKKDKEIWEKKEEIEELKKKILETGVEKDKVIDQLKTKIDENKTKEEYAISIAINEKEREKNKEISEKMREIEVLNGQLKTSVLDKELAVSKARQEKEQEISEKNARITELKGLLSNKETENKLTEKSLKEKYEEVIKQKDEQIEYYKDFKSRQSTKMVGESLEQHCLNEFNAWRMTAFPTAYFEKDNDIRTGSKGDFIFRESIDGIEYISIMFEMKNEMDKTATKHKNEDFFKELDKDRREKGCEYAVLVSLLEIDSDLYNKGIVDVSYKYEKMYVIRPQFFIPIITLLRNAALNSIKYRQELEQIKNQQPDILHFEENMNEFKKKFKYNYDLASKRFANAIKEIDKTIEHLQKTKSELLASENQLRLANDKAEDLSIKKLTQKAPAVKEMFEKLHSEEGTV